MRRDGGHERPEEGGREEHWTEKMIQSLPWHDLFPPQKILIFFSHLMKVSHQERISGETSNPQSRNKIRRSQKATHWDGSTSSKH
jgi:hypothetical protein